jgi:hypothetical protein
LAKTSAQREAYKLAAEQCSKYAEEIVPLMNQCDRELDERGLSDLLDLFSVEVHGDGVFIKPKNPITSDQAQKLFGREMIHSTLPVQNALDTFAVMFTTGVAAEEGAFSSVGRSFCYNVKKHAPLIVPFAGSSGHPGSGHHQNALQLFVIWQHRIDQQELLAKQESLSKLLSQTQDIKIRPIGT